MKPIGAHRWLNSGRILGVWVLVVAGAGMAFAQAQAPVTTAPTPAAPAPVTPASSSSAASAPKSTSSAKAPAPTSPSAAPDASSAPTPATVASPPAAAPGAAPIVVSKRKTLPPLPPPTAEQLRAFNLLEQEMTEYERSAKDYHGTLSMIVRHHYEERRQRVLAGFDKEIDVDKKALDAARNDAIARLEAFVKLYSGANADPEATPDAMFRLAALYEERGRADFDANLAERLVPAIQLYRRIIREFPNYQELAGVYYYLGHAYTDGGQIDEGQQAWRSLVCHNHYSVGDDPSDSEKIASQPMPQDHDQAFWDKWYAKHPVPLDQASAYRRAKLSTAVGVADEELRFRDPYATCEPVAQVVEPGAEPRYLAEIWWQLGNYHFDQVDPYGGPYSLNRAMSAYERSMEFKKPPLYGVAMYKRAWTYFKQQRYHTAVQWFTELLHYADEQQEKTGDPGADFRAEAYTYIAGSLTYVDFDGPPAEDPYIPRNDVLDVETNPVAAEDKMHIAVDRVQDPALIPQDKKWTVEIYKALAQEFIEITQNRNAIATLELTLSKFPMDRDAPKMQNKVAELYDQLFRLAPEGSAVREEYAAKALDARTKLASYVGATPWTQANKDDPEALAEAEQLVRQGLQRAAADHTNYARGYYAKASQVQDETEQRGFLEKAISEYRLAEIGWAGYISQDPTAMDSYESRFWLADARFWIVVLQVTLGRSPTETEVSGAREAAIDVRDSNDDDKYLQPAAYYLVTIADKVLDDRYREYQASNGARGLEKHEEVKFEGEGEKRKVVALPLPDETTQAIRSRDEYNDRVLPDRDPEKNGLLYSFQAADFYFVYGQLDEARKRYEPLMTENCGKNQWGYKAWEKLISISNFQNDADRSRQLAEGKSCAFDEDTRAAEEAIRTPVRQGVAYLDARKLYDEAEKMPSGPERDKKWRQAAAAYKVALDAAPDRDEAPEAAMNGAYAYKQVGEYDKAIEMYELFISRYGNKQKLDALKNGDPAAKPPVPADPSKYESRVKFLKLAYDALANAYVLFFDYPKAADTFRTISETDAFSADERREAAQQALSLYASLNDAKGMARSRQQFTALGANPKQIAEADFVVASAALKQWDQFSPDTGANATARQRAETQMQAYHDANLKNDSASEFVVEAAYWDAKMKHASHDPAEDQWWKKTTDAFDRFKASAPKKPDGTSSALGSRQASFAAEAAFVLLDEQVRKDFDYDTGHHRFRGTPTEVLAAYQKDAQAAKAWYDKLQVVVDGYAAPEWATAAIARQGSLYDSLRTGLYNVRPPELKMFDAKTEAVLKKAEGSDNPDLQEKADAVRVSVETAWRDKRDQELNSADEIVVDRYATSIVLARRYNISNPAVVKAIQRLAFFTDVMGEAKLKQYTARVPDLNYTEGMFLRIRPGLVTAPDPVGMGTPLPAAPR